MVIEDTLDFTKEYEERKRKHERGSTNVININETLGDDTNDRGIWYSIELDTYGETREELLENATISYVDQDGGELDTMGIDDYQEIVENIIDETLKASSPTCQSCTLES